MKIQKKFKHLFNQIRDVKLINKRLKDIIKDCGIEESMPFIELISGEKFFGFGTEYYQNRLYFLFSKEIKKKIGKCRECINLLYDINFRFLKPKTLKDTFDVGKYYDVEEGAVVLELGAYIGMYAVKMAQIVGDKGKVVAVESIGRNFDILKKNININNFENIIAINKAVWHEKGVLQFYSNKKQDNSAITGVVDKKEIIDVSSDTVDNIVAENNLTRVDFVRIQVNGAEKNVLEGMEETLKLKPVIMITVVYKEKNNVVKILHEKGYKTEIFKYAILAKPE